LVDAIRDAVAIRVLRTAARIHGRSRDCVGALIDAIGNSVAVGVDRTAVGIDLCSDRRVRALVLGIRNLVLVVVAATHTANRELDTTGVLEVVDGVRSGRDGRAVGEVPDVVPDFGESEARIDAELESGSELPAVLVLGPGTESSSAKSNLASPNPRSHTARDEGRAGGSPTPHRRGSTVTSRGGGAGGNPIAW
jgi:hypothetical protein